MQSVQTRPSNRKTRTARRRADAHYRNFRIVMGERGDHFAGVAYAGKIPVFDADAETLDGVDDALRNKIDADLNERRAKAASSYWICEDYVLALYLISPIMTPVQTHILRRVAEADGGPLDLEQLRWPSAFVDDAVTRGLSRLARMVSHALDGSAASGSAGPQSALATLIDGDDMPPWRFRRAFVAAAREFAEAVL